VTSDDPHGDAGPPHSVASEEEFVVALRRLRERSGLTFKEVEKRTSAEGLLVLPASTLATALHRRNAPRPELVATLVRVCGGTPEVVAEWLAVRESLVHPLPTAPPASASRTEPEAETESRDVGQSSGRPGRRVIGVLAAVLCLAAAVGAFEVIRSSGASGDAGAGDPAPASVTTEARPSIGDGLLKIGGFCLSEHDYDRTGRVYLSSCAKSFPPRQLKPYGATWRVTTDHPQFGPGCMGVVDGSTKAGADMSDDTCDGIQTDRFALDRVTGGFLLEPEHRRFCVGVTGTPKIGAKLKQLACDGQAPGQLFTIS
jgi:hypothetical protein